MAAKAADLFVYIIDPSALPGKTYRYKIVYKVLNPLFDKAPQHAANKNWVDQFDIVSPMSDFSPEITVPLQTYFFCGKTQGLAKSNTCPFEVFTWAAGKWQKDTFNVNLGDPIGGTDGGVDYSTGYSYVDRRSPKSGNKTFVTLVDQEGIADIRDLAKDANSKEHQEKIQWVEQSKSGLAAQPAAVQPPTGGGPPGMYQPGGPPGGPILPPTQ
jgi:hypothetical protein